MEKNIYFYLSIFVVLYGLYRLNTPEHYKNYEEDNVTVYIKSKYNLDEEIKEKSEVEKKEREFIELKEKEEKMRQIKIRENQIKQFEDAKTQITNAQNQELLIKQSQLEAKLALKNRELEEIAKQKAFEQEQEKQKLEQERQKLEQERQKLEIEKITKSNEIEQEKAEQEKQKLEQEKQEQQKQEEEIQKAKRYEKGFIHNLHDNITSNVRNTIKNTLNLSDSTYPQKTYTERFNQIKDTLYEYLSATPSTFFNTAKTCGFSYILIGDFVETPLAKGQMQRKLKDKDNKSDRLILHYADRTGLTGINMPLSENTLMITDGVSKYQIGISNFESDINTGNFSVKIYTSGIPDSFFNQSSIYILFECDKTVEERSILLENQIWISFLVFIGLIIFSLLIINYTAVIDGFTYIKNWVYPTKSSKIEGGKNVFYVGGYDYRDYSD